MTNARWEKKERKKKKKESVKDCTEEIAKTREKKEKEKSISTQHYFNVHKYAQPTTRHLICSCEQTIRNEEKTEIHCSSSFFLYILLFHENNWQSLT
jgi:hypothetical protein